MLETEDDLAADIRSAMTTEPEPQDPPEPPVTEPVATEGQPQEGEKGPQRGPDGKFVAKAAEEGDTHLEQPKEPETPQESIRPPASWSATAKAKFAALDPDVQREVLKREQDVEKGFRERASQVKRYEPLEQTIAPYREKWAVAGVDEATAVKQLLAASDWLERDPQAAIAYLAKQYGVNPAQVQGQPQQAQPNGNSPTPEYQALQQRFDALERQLAERESQSYQSQIDSFSSDPNNLYFENVRPQMAALLEAGQASDLADAYEKACWMNPEIRSLLQKPVVQPARSAAAAKAAGASVTGAPPTHASAASSNGSIEDDIRLALEQATSRA
jgi:hypothetical protein